MARSTAVVLGVGLGLGLALPACGGDGGGGEHRLDCEWAASDANCWLALVDQIATCAVPEAATGVFDASRTRCTYAEGWDIVFDQPVPASVPDSYAWRFTVSRAGTSCVRYDQGSADPAVIELEVESAGQVVHASGNQADLSYTLTCPDGERYTTNDPFSVLTCGEPRAYKLPVLTLRTSLGAVGLSIPLGEEPGGGDIEVPLFTCEDPPS